MCSRWGQLTAAAAYFSCSEVCHSPQHSPGSCVSRRVPTRWSAWFLQVYKLDTCASEASPTFQLPTTFTLQHVPCLYLRPFLASNLLPYFQILRDHSRKECHRSRKGLVSEPHSPKEKRWDTPMTSPVASAQLPYVGWFPLQYWEFCRARCSVTVSESAECLNLGILCVDRITPCCQGRPVHCGH